MIANAQRCDYIQQSLFYKRVSFTRTLINIIFIVFITITTAIIIIIIFIAVIVVIVIVTVIYIVIVIVILVITPSFVSNVIEELQFWEV